MLAAVSKPQAVKYKPLFMNKIDMIDSCWFSLFDKALIGCSGNIFLSKKRVVKRAIAIADEAFKELNENG